MLRVSARLRIWTLSTTTVRRNVLSCNTPQHWVLNMRGKAPVRSGSSATAPFVAEEEEGPFDVWERRVQPHYYTSGRWLHRNTLQQKSRYIDFNFPALCEKAIRLCPGASRVVQCEKREGGFNRVFLMTMDNNLRVVARLPTRIAGPPRLTTNSEVATMTYLRTHTSIPIPRILDWSDNKSSSIGAEHIIMEHVAGVRLDEKWEEMNVLQHMQCTKALSKFAKDMEQINFPAYGSLYFENAIDPGLRVDFADGYCIGPHCGSTYWNCSPGERELYGESNSNHGPWRDLSSYCAGLVDTGFARLPKIDVGKQLPYRGSVDEHVSLLKLSQAVLERLISNTLVQNAALPTLLHADYHKRNIYVSEEEPTIITGIIDWQSTCIEPAFLYAGEKPDFASLPDKISFVEGEEETEDEKKAKEDASICSQTFDVCMMGRVPKLARARELDEMLFRPFRYCHTSWRDSASAVRQELVDLGQHWVELGLTGTSPYLPTEKELAEHKKRYEDFDNAQRLKAGMMQALGVNSDGWFSEDRRNTVSEAYSKMYQMWIETAKDSEASEEDKDKVSPEKAQMLWPFDER